MLIDKLAKLLLTVVSHNVLLLETTLMRVRFSKKKKKVLKIFIFLTKKTIK